MHRQRNIRANGLSYPHTNVVQTIIFPQWSGACRPTEKLFAPTLTASPSSFKQQTPSIQWECVTTVALQQSKNPPSPPSGSLVHAVGALNRLRRRVIARHRLANRPGLFGRVSRTGRFNRIRVREKKFSSLLPVCRVPRMLDRAKLMYSLK